MQPKHQGTENAGEMVYVKLSDTLSGCIKCSSPNRGWHDNQRLPGELLFLCIAHDDGLYPPLQQYPPSPQQQLRRLWWLVPLPIMTLLALV